MEYFPEDFASANGFSLAGGTIGMMVLPPIVEHLMSGYGWRNALGLMGAFSFNYVVCGAVLRPCNKTTSAAKYKRVPTQSDTDNVTSTAMEQTNAGNLIEDTGPEKFGCFKNILKNISERFDVYSLTDPLFIVFQLVSLLEGMIFAMWHLYLIPQGVELGFGDSPSAFLATFGGLGSLIGRLGHGIPIDRGLIQSSSLFIIACLVFAASNMLDPLCVSSYPAIAGIASVSGVAMGLIYPLTFVLMRDITSERHMSAFGWLFVTHGAGQVLGGILAGRFA